MTCENPMFCRHHVVDCEMCVAEDLVLQDPELRVSAETMAKMLLKMSLTVRSRGSGINHQLWMLYIAETLQRGIEAVATDAVRSMLGERQQPAPHGQPMNTDITINPLTLTLANARHGDLVVFNHAYSGGRGYMLRIAHIDYRIIQEVIQKLGVGGGDSTAINRVGVGFDLNLCLVRAADEVGEILAIVPREHLRLTNAPSGTVNPTTLAEVRLEMDNAAAERQEAMRADVRRLQLENDELKAALSAAKALAERLDADVCDQLAALRVAEGTRERWQQAAARHLRNLEAECKLRNGYEARFLKLHELRKTDQGSWAWLGDGEDHLESMSDGMIVHIQAGDLKKLLVEAADTGDAGGVP